MGEVERLRGDLDTAGGRITKSRSGGIGSALAFGLYALEAVFVGLTVWSQWGRSPDLRPLDISVGVITVLLLPALWRWPVPTGYVLAVLAAVSVAATPVAALAVLQVAKRRRLAEAVRLGAVAVAAHLVRGLWQSLPGLSFGALVIEVCAVAGALVGWGAYSRSRSALIASLREQAWRAEAEQGRVIAAARAAERGRIAREMHDVLAHRLTLLTTYAGALEYRSEIEPEKISEVAGVIRSNARAALVELRQVVYVLRDEGSDEFELGDALERPQPCLGDVPELVDQSRAAGTQVSLDLRVAEPSECRSVVGRTAYRVIQEALTNARRHALGAPVFVLVEGGPGRELTIDVRNALVVAEPESTGSGTGLIGLAERVGLAGGSAEFGPVDGEFRLRVAIPWAM